MIVESEGSRIVAVLAYGFGNKHGIFAVGSVPVASIKNTDCIIVV